MTYWEPRHGYRWESQPCPNFLLASAKLDVYKKGQTKKRRKNYKKWEKTGEYGKRKKGFLARGHFFKLKMGK